MGWTALICGKIVFQFTQTLNILFIFNPYQFKIASQHGFFEIVKYLVEKGADKSIRDLTENDALFAGMQLF